MTCELPDIVTFLRRVAPFVRSSNDVLEGMAGAADVKYARAGDRVLEAGSPNSTLYLVRSGAVELYEEGTDFSARLDEGSFFAYPSLMKRAPVRNMVKAVEDTLLYCFPAEAFKAAMLADETVDSFFHAAESDRLRSALKLRLASSEGGGNTPAMDTPLSDLISRQPVTGTPDMTVHAAALHMSENNVSTLMIVDGDGALIGLVSDKDLTNRVLAAGLSAETQIRDIMTTDVKVFAPDTKLIEALLVMMQGRFRQAPIMDDQGILMGLVSGTDMMHRLASSGVQIVRSVQSAGSLEELTGLLEDQRRMVVDLRRSSVSGVRIADFVSAVGMAVHRRIFELAVDDMGPQPVPVAFVCFGSLARGEQSALTDQDHGFILDDHYDEAQHGAYFQLLGQCVSDALDACGYTYCKGGIMASNEAWRQPLSVWCKKFRSWVLAPKPEGLMHTSIFFDMAHVGGMSALSMKLKEEVLGITKGAGVFLARMTENALKSKPPIGFFRQFVLSTHGDEASTFNVKTEGLVPIQDIARIHALAHGVPSVKTIARLRALKDRKVIAASDADELMDAYQFLTDVRFDHQAAQLEAGKKPTNFIAPSALSRFEREHMRAAFKLVQLHQDGLSRAMAGGYY